MNYFIESILSISILYSSIQILFHAHSSMVPPFLRRGPPVLQHPERVVPLSECERFEPHFQPNVALAPIPTPTMPPVAPPPPVQTHRRHNHERRRHNHCSTSPTSPTCEKSESLAVEVKLEKPSTPGPESAGGSYSPLLARETDENPNHESDRQDAQERREEEESSAAVTSSTVTMETPPVEVGTSSPESDSDTENCCAAVQLEERLMALDVPQDVLALARQTVLENARFRTRHRSDTREIIRLREQLEMQKIQSVNDTTEKNDVANASVADSTEGSEETEVNPPSTNNLMATLTATSNH